MFCMPTCGVGANAAPEAWSDVSVGTLITSLVSTPSTLYAAGEDGVYRYAAAGWSPLDAGLPSSTSHRIVELTGDPDGLVVVVQVPDASQVYPPKQAYRLGADGTWAPFGPRLAPEDDVIAAEPTGLWVDSFGLVSMSVGVEHTLSWVPLTGARVVVAAREPGTNVRFVVEGDTLVRIAWPTGTDATEVPHTVSTSVDRGQTWRAVEPAMSMVPILATTPAGLALFAGDELLTSPDLQRWTSVSTTGLPGGEPETAVACGGDLLVSFEGASTIYARRIDRVEP
jgi:hypothetical protein